MRRNIKAANGISYFLAEHHQETNNNKINPKNHSRIRKSLTYFVPEHAKCCCTMLSILLYVCLDKVRLCHFFSIIFFTSVVSLAIRYFTPVI